jgi:hypothetical protein
MMHPDEIRARESVVARLRYRFPDAPTPDVIQAVANCFEQYVNARVRDFIELLPKPFCMTSDLLNVHTRKTMIGI